MSTALDECPTLLRDLDLAIAAGSASEIRRLAHSVKGALRLFEDGGVTKFAEQLEGMGTTNRLDGATDVLASLHRAVNEVMQMLRQFPSMSSWTPATPYGAGVSTPMMRYRACRRGRSTD